MRLQLTIVASVLFFIVLTCPVAQAENQVALDRLRGGHALLIGNYQYQDANWPTLDDVPLQLTALASGLKAHFETVEIVQNLKAEELRRKINSFVRTFGNDPMARLFIYYAGHGYTETILQRNENRGYITGIDTPHFSQGYAVARLKAISMMEIRAPLAEVLAQHILFVFDSCFSGTIFTTRSTPPAFELTPDVVARLLEKPSRDFITAGRANEFVPAHSPLPELLLAALNGEADRYRHGVVSAAEITQYIRDKLLPLRDVNLTPQEGKLPDPAFAEGEFLFRVIPAPIVALPKSTGQNAPEKAAVLAPVPTAVPRAIETSPSFVAPRATGNVYFWVQAKVMDPNNKVQPDFHQPHEGTVEWQLNESKDNQKETFLRADVSFPKSTWHPLLTIELARNTRDLVWKFGFPDINNVPKKVKSVTALELSNDGQQFLPLRARIWTVEDNIFVSELAGYPLSGEDVPGQNVKLLTSSKYLRASVVFDDGRKGQFTIATQPANRFIADVFSKWNLVAEKYGSLP